MEEQFVIERAVREQAHLRLAISGVSGSGKTKGGLRLARGIVEYMLEQGLIGGTLEGKVGVIDTERNSASLYARMYPFDRISLVAPYTVKRYLAAAQAMAAAGKTVVMIDQISHQWSGQGGMLEFVDLLRARNRKAGNANEFTAWADATPEQNEFLEGLLALPCHLICTMRAKTAYVVEEKTRRDGTKYHAPRRVGVKPIQREGVEYEFTTVMDLELQTKTATVSKDRTELFVDPVTLESKTFILTEQVGKDLAKWLLSGEAMSAPAAIPAVERAQAIAQSAIRQMEDAQNLPDLARLWDSAQRELRAFSPVMDREVLKAMISEAEAAKDRRKAILKPAGAAPGDYIDPAAAVELEQLLADTGVPLATGLDQLGVARLGLIPAGKLQDAVDWIAEECLANTGRPLALPKRLRDMGVHVKARAPMGAFDDMEDDLPWRG